MKSYAWETSVEIGKNMGIIRKQDKVFFCSWHIRG